MDSSLVSFIQLQQCLISCLKTQQDHITVYKRTVIQQLARNNFRIKLK